VVRRGTEHLIIFLAAVKERIRETGERRRRQIRKAERPVHNHGP
jgi:hypothetical protein